MTMSSREGPAGRPQDPGDGLVQGGLTTLEGSAGPGLSHCLPLWELSRDCSPLAQPRTAHQMRSEARAEVQGHTVAISPDGQ